MTANIAVPQSSPRGGGGVRPSARGPFSWARWRRFRRGCGGWSHGGSSRPGTLLPPPSRPVTSSSATPRPSWPGGSWCGGAAKCGTAGHDTLSCGGASWSSSGMPGCLRGSSSRGAWTMPRRGSSGAGVCTQGRWRCIGRRPPQPASRRASAACSRGTTSTSWTARRWAASSPRASSSRGGGCGRRATTACSRTRRRGGR
mmetsp:Transcript_21135/g.66937  ORF Transcript_21135/g.66937 Transcript_21135/m.66937 type:complete len:200 (+) Transcript_21135:667-1266(+)